MSREQDSYDPAAFGARLTSESAKAGLTVRDLEREIRARIGPVRGTSRANLATWLRGQGPAPDAGEPRRNVVEALARVFSTPASAVRPEHLLYGGPRTEAEAAAEEEARQHTPVYDEVRAHIPFLRELPLRFAVALVDHVALATVLDDLRHPERRGESDEQLRGRLLRFAAEAWEDILRTVPHHMLRNYEGWGYLDAALHARNLAVRLNMSHEHRATSREKNDGSEA